MRLYKHFILFIICIIIASSLRKEVLAQTISVSVNPAVSVHPFRPEMLGVAHANWEHSWGKPFPNQVPGLKQAYKAANIKLIRYAGGLWSNYVGWQRAPQQTPYTDWHPNPAKFHPQFANQIKTTETYSFHYGTNEIDDLAAFVSALGADVVIQVNIANNDPAMWADLLHYTNIEHTYKFKYWEIGNELDHETALGISPAQYATRLAGYIDALKAVDPSIVIIGGVPASGHDFYRTQDYSGNVTGMSQYISSAAGLTTPGGRKIDSLSYHWYQNCNNNKPADMLVYDFPSTPVNSWQNVYGRVWSKIGPTRLQNEIINPSVPTATQGITELNYDACDFGIAPQNANFTNALWAADVLGRLAYNGIDYVTWYEGFGDQAQGYPAIYSVPNTTSPTGISLRPSYYTLFMYGNYFGDQLVQVSDPNPASLSVWASTDSRDPGSLKLMVTNLTGASIQSSISLGSFSPASAKAYVLSNPTPLNMTTTSHVRNGGTTINGVVLNDMNVTASALQIQPQTPPVSQNGITYTFAPYSVTALILRSQEGTLLLGDANSDRVVNILDYTILSNNFGKGASTADFNTDGQTNVLDYTILSNNFGKTAR